MKVGIRRIAVTVPSIDYLKGEPITLPAEYGTCEPFQVDIGYTQDEKHHLFVWVREAAE